MSTPPWPVPADLVCAVLRRPQQLASCDPSEWDVLVRQARRAGLLGRIGYMLDAQGSLDAVADAPRAHLRAAMLQAEAQHAQAMRELALLGDALEPTGVTPVLLGGTAYVATGLLPAMGRFCEEIDILVPLNQLAEVEATLVADGWDATHHTAYDQRYYRQWLNELPPFRHRRRQSQLHVHHGIVPETPPKANPVKWLAAAHLLDNDDRFAVLAPTDIVLHSMVHLFHNDDLSHALRDLSDLDLLLRHGSRSPGFWAELGERARDLGVSRPLHYGLRYTRALLGTPIPADALTAAAANGPGSMREALNDQLWSHALRPQHATVADAWTPLARFALHALALRQHMPPWRLLHHLTVKALRRNDAMASRIQPRQAVETP